MNLSLSHGMDIIAHRCLEWMSISPFISFSLPLSEHFISLFAHSLSLSGPSLTIIWTVHSYEHQLFASSLTRRHAWAFSLWSLLLSLQIFSHSFQLIHSFILQDGPVHSAPCVHHFPIFVIYSKNSLKMICPTLLLLSFYAPLLPFQMNGIHKKD